MLEHSEKSLSIGTPKYNWGGMHSTVQSGFYDDYLIAAEEKKALGPTEEQQALAGLLDSIGDWPLFLTFTFRPNKHEEILQQRNGEFFRNKKLALSETVIKGKKRGYRGEWESGAIIKGTPSIAPGWSPHAAEKSVMQFVTRDRELKRTRWFEVIEGSKYRNCAHGHALVANASRVNWDRVDKEWQEKYGRFRVELTETKEGMAAYLAKQYVGKSYGSEQCRFQFSNNCRRPKEDPIPRAWYGERMREYKKFCAGNGNNKNLGNLNDYARRKRKG